MKRSLNRVGPSGKKCQKLQRLSAVFMKAVDVSISAIKKEDLIECFGHLTERHGNLIEKSLVAELGKSRDILEVLTVRIFIRCDFLLTLHIVTHPSPGRIRSN